MGNVKWNANKNDLEHDLKTLLTIYDTYNNEALKIHPIVIYETFRTKEKQNLYYKNGSSKCDGIKKRSKHQDNKAFDFCINSKNDSFNKILMNEVIEIFKIICKENNLNSIIFGADWKTFIDIPHVETK